MTMLEVGEVIIEIVLVMSVAVVRFAGFAEAVSFASTFWSSPC